MCPHSFEHRESVVSPSADSMLMSVRERRASSPGVPGDVRQCGLASAGDPVNCIVCLLCVTSSSLGGRRHGDRLLGSSIAFGERAREPWYRAAFDVG